jgi:hypothetical protein
MTDRIHSFLVVLNKDLRTDDAEATLNALKQIKGVVDVKPVISDFDSVMAYSRAKSELVAKILSTLKEIQNSSSQ